MRVRIQLIAEHATQCHDHDATAELPCVEMGHGTSEHRTHTVGRWRGPQVIMGGLHNA